MPTASLRSPWSRHSATKRSLLEVARAQFAEHGYAATNLDAVVAGAAVTKGALYHHFTGKQALFEAVFVQVEEDATASIRREVAEHTDPWEQARGALRAFLSVVRQPEYRRVVLQDGPAVLGYERFREQKGSSEALVHDVTERVLLASTPDVAPTMVDTFSSILLGAMSSAGEQVARASDPEAETLRVELAIGVILEGLRVQAGAGLSLQDPA